MLKKQIKVINIVGARPNFMKIAPIIEEMEKVGFDQILVHTGQHYDYQMSKLFFDELELPRPHIDLGVGSGTHAEQTGEIMKRIEPIFVKEAPDLVLVVGDVNSTLACALTASKMGIPVAHVEAGLRSFDRSMPEEINRILTDAISTYLFVTEHSGLVNLINEGIPKEKIFFVGNTMIDTLLKHKKRAEMISPLNGVNIKGRSYGVLTLHRPSNVENRENMKNIFEALTDISHDIPIIFPVHPRTLKQIETFGLSGLLSEITSEIKTGIYMIEPLGYLQFLSLMIGAKIVFTDSGGIQEETTVLGIPCITLRENTERPITLTSGTNILVGANKDRILRAAKEGLNGFESDKQIPVFWDGKAAKRIVKILVNELTKYKDDKKN
jgi:UDP-N-acetylglucosamine 2-epimerase (non-hydrolysing)